MQKNTSPPFPLPGAHALGGDEFGAPARQQQRLRQDNDISGPTGPCWRRTPNCTASKDLIAFRKAQPPSAPNLLPVETLTNGRLFDERGSAGLAAYRHAAGLYDSPRANVVSRCTHVQQHRGRHHLPLPPGSGTHASYRPDAPAIAISLPRPGPEQRLRMPRGPYVLSAIAPRHWVDSTRSR